MVYSSASNEHELNDESGDPPAQDTQHGFVLPWEHLSQDALRGVVEAVLVAQVADQNVENFELGREVDKVLTGLASGDWLLVFDPETETPTLRRPETR